MSTTVPAPGARAITAEETRSNNSLRWVILALLFFSTTINYLDRSILGVLMPEIRTQFGLTTETYGIIQSLFQAAYGAASLAGGYFLDRVGTRIGFGLAVAFWSAAATLNAFAMNVFQFGFLRTMLAVGEGPTFPAMNKSTTEHFPPSERTMAMGVVNFGVNMGQIIGPPIFILIATALGWRWTFGIMGLLGFVWVPFWLKLAKPKAGPVEVALPAMSVPEVLRYRQAWGIGLAKFFSDQGWWFYMFWLSPYFADVRHVSPQERGTILSVIYLISGFGALVGGYATTFLMKQGWMVGRAKKTTMLLWAIMMPLGATGMLAPTAWGAAMLFGLAAFAHQAWMTNLFTIPGDVFPKNGVGSANGFGIACGAWGSAVFAALIPGYVIPLVGYYPVLMTISLFYLVGWAMVHFLLRNLEPIEIHA